MSVKAEQQSDKSTLSCFSLWKNKRRKIRGEKNPEVIDRLNMRLEEKQLIRVCGFFVTFHWGGFVLPLLIWQQKKEHKGELSF